MKETSVRTPKAKIKDYCLNKVKVLSINKPSTTTRMHYIHEDKVFYNETSL